MWAVSLNGEYIPCLWFIIEKVMFNIGYNFILHSKVLINTPFMPHPWTNFFTQILAGLSKNTIMHPDSYCIYMIPNDSM